MVRPNILVTFDAMKHANSGYFSFGKGLGDALITQNRDRFNLNFYMFKKTSYFFNGLANIVYLNRLHNLFFPKRSDFDVVHFSDQAARLKPRSVKGKKIVTIHDLNRVHLPFATERQKRKRINAVRSYVVACDKVVAISKFVADDVLKYIPEAAGKISVIYNGADKLVVPAGHEPAYKPTKPFLFTIGLMSPQKGFHHLPALLEGNDYQLIIAGKETAHKEAIIAQANKYNVLDRVTITGPVSDADKAWYFKNCAALVFPSLTEGFGLPVIEAMYFGKPVFLARATSLPEVGGELAYYFDNFEAEHMQQVFEAGMADFASSDKTVAIIAHASRFSWDETARQYLALYSDLLK